MTSEQNLIGKQMRPVEYFTGLIHYLRRMQTSIAENTQNIEQIDEDVVNIQEKVQCIE